eukprot:7133819-Pyramimonas_sp.AAC.2
MPPCLAACSGPRVCRIQGELAEPIRPLCGLPQGDSMAPSAMRATLVPWQPLCKNHTCSWTTGPSWRRVLSS